MEETQVQAENTEAVEDNSLEASPATEPTTSDDTQATDNQTSSAEESGDETSSETSERKPSRAERRIRDLTERLKQYEGQPNNQQFSQFQQPPQPMFEYGQEYSPQELEQRMVQAANNIASLQTQAQIEQYKAQVNLDRDVEVLPKEYPELDDASDDFVPELLDSIEEEFKSKAVRNGVLDPSVRLAEIAKRHVNAVRAAAKKSEAKMRNAVASSADTSAIKPGKTAKEEKSIDQMSANEIEDMMKKQGRYIKA